MRYFREIFVMKLPNHNDILIEYQNCSLLLVPFIKEDFDKVALCENIYTNSITKAVEFIKNEDYKNAFDVYIQVLMNLLKRYNVDINQFNLKLV
jgi:hypothetical protein